MASHSNYTKLAGNALNSVDKINTEVLAMFHGALVMQVLKDMDDVHVANQKMHDLGVEAGGRLIEEFLASTQIDSCTSFEETCHIIAKVALKIFIGVQGDVVPGAANVFYINLIHNPLADFVDLPPSLKGLEYNAYICGAIQGALEKIQLKVAVTVTKDVLYDDDVTQFRLQLVEVQQETFVDLDGV